MSTKSLLILTLSLLFTMTAFADDCKTALQPGAPGRYRISGGQSGFVADYYNLMRTKVREEKLPLAKAGNESFFGFNVGNMKFQLHTYDQDTSVKVEYSIDLSACSFDDVFVWYQNLRSEDLENRPVVERKITKSFRQILENRGLYFDGDYAWQIMRSFADAQAKGEFPTAVSVSEDKDGSSIRGFNFAGITMRSILSEGTETSRKQSRIIVDLRNAKSVEAVNSVVKTMIDVGPSPVTGMITRGGLPVIRARYPVTPEEIEAKQKAITQRQIDTKLKLQADADAIQAKSTARLNDTALVEANLHRANEQREAIDKANKAREAALSAKLNDDERIAANLIKAAQAKEDLEIAAKKREADSAARIAMPEVRAANERTGARTRAALEAQRQATIETVDNRLAMPEVRDQNVSRQDQTRNQLEANFRQTRDAKNARMAAIRTNARDSVTPTNPFKNVTNINGTDFVDPATGDTVSAARVVQDNSLPAARSAADSSQQPAQRTARTKP